MAQVEKTCLNVCHYQWELLGIEHKPVTILSKMVKIQGVESFRVGIVNEASKSTVFLMTKNLNKIGLKAEAVTVSYCSPHKDIQHNMKHVTISKGDEEETDGCLQLFRTTEPPDFLQYFTITGKASFIFQIYMSSAIQTYQFQEVDLLLRNQLWSSFLDQDGTDFKILAEGIRFPVHKYILAARSSVFAAMFKEKKQEGTEIIDFVSAYSVGTFIKFLYSGQLNGSQLNLEHLMHLAVFYKVKTLEDICLAASRDINLDQAALLEMTLKPSVAHEITIKPDADFEINELSTSVIFTCTANEDLTDTGNVSSRILSEKFVYQQQIYFRVHLQRNYRVPQFEYPPHPMYSLYRRQPQWVSTATTMGLKLVFLCYHQENLNYKVEEVYSTDDVDLFLRFKMRHTPTSDGELLQVFALDLINIPSSVTFRVKMASTVPNFGPILSDSTFTEQLWTAAIHKVLTDVVFLIAGQYISAHRPLLSARSPVFAAMFASGMEEARTGQVRIDDVDSVTFYYFLYFLYTGTLGPTADKAKLFIVADKYQVETLMDLCSPLNLAADIDDFAVALLSC